MLIDAQIDRIVGPTHHFGGLGVGNVASEKHSGRVSCPKAAALEGLDRMRWVAQLGVPQFILPPHPRPQLDFLTQAGFQGSPLEQLREAQDVSIDLVSAAFSSSAMWTANAATVSPAVDTQHHRTCVTVANLVASLHRAIEPKITQDHLVSILPDSIEVHQALPSTIQLSDEGAANHMRLSVPDEKVRGVHVFVHGDGPSPPQRYRPRQTELAFRCIAKQHQLYSDSTFFLQQHPAAIDAGAFHNDVVAMSHHDVWIHHEQAYVETADFTKIEKKFRELTGSPLNRIAVTETELSLADAIQTYLFNSQILSIDSADSPLLICPSQVAENASAKRLVSEWIKQGIFSDVHYVELNQSMSGGGGPACLRLRVPMTDELASMKPSASWSPELDSKLRQIIDSGYPESLTLSQLLDQQAIKQADEVTAEIQTLLLG